MAIHGCVYTATPIGAVDLWQLIPDYWRIRANWSKHETAISLSREMLNTREALCVRGYGRVGEAPTNLNIVIQKAMLKVQADNIR